MVMDTISVTRTRYMLGGKMLVTYGPNAMKMRLADGWNIRRREGFFMRTPWLSVSWHRPHRVLYVRAGSRWFSAQPGIN